MILTTAYDVDISRPLLPTPLQQMLITKDAGANRIAVNLFNGREPFSPGGVCAGFAVRRDGITVPIETGAVSGNQMYIDLPADAYAIEGPINIGIKNINESEGRETTVFLGLGVVSLGETDAAIEPGSMIVSIAALIAQIQSAVASIPADYSALLATIAPTYADLTFPVSAGTYCWYSGVLYRAKQDIASSESWTSAHWETAVLGDDLAGVRNIAYGFQGQEITGDLTWTNNSSIKSGDGATTYNNYQMTSGLVDLTGASAVKFNAIAISSSSARASAAFYDANGDFVRAIVRTSETDGYGFLELLVPAGVKYIRFAKYKSEANTKFCAFIVKSATNEPCTQIAVNQSGISALNASTAQLRTDLNDYVPLLGIVSEEIRGPEGWTYYGTGYFGNGDILPSNSYYIYYFIASEDFNLWTDGNASDGTRIYIRVFNSSTFSDATLAAQCGSQQRNDQGVITSDTTPKASNPQHVTAGQYVAVSITKYATFIRLLSDGDALAQKFMASNVILAPEQIRQVENAQITPLIEKIEYLEDDVTRKRIYVYIPTENKKYFIRYSFSYTHHGIDGAATDNGDGWRMNSLYLCNLDKSVLKYIAYSGEWEMAIKLDGRSDFIGLGNHGDEIQTAFRLYVDGQSITENATFEARPFAEAQLICTLTMYDPSDHTTVVGTHTRIDTINAARKTFTVENHVEFANSYTMKPSYLFMAPLARDNNGVQITDYYIDNEDYILTDCSTTTFNPSDANHGVGESKNEVSEYKFWGSGLNLHGYAKILHRSAPAGNTFFGNISDASSYNKIYLSMCRDGETVSAGDVWRMATEFFVDFGYDPVS